VINAYWTVYPNITLPAGTYTVLDSSSATWSQNSSSGGAGHTRIEGYPAGQSNSSVPTGYFEKPTYKGYRLDFCREWATDCGKGAADVFCRMKGYSYAESWAVDSDIGHISPTIVITTEQICDKILLGVQIY